MNTKLAQVWLIGDRVSASGSGRAIRCPILDSESHWLIAARRVSGSGALTLRFRTGATDSGPWTTLATIGPSGTIVTRAGIPHGRLESFIVVEYDVDDGTIFDLHAQLLGPSKYPTDAVSAGAADITGSAGGTPLSAYSVADITSGPTPYIGTAAGSVAGAGDWIDLGAAPTADAIAVAEGAVNPTGFGDPPLPPAQDGTISFALETADDTSGTNLEVVHVFTVRANGSDNGARTYIAAAGELRRFVRVNISATGTVVNADYSLALLYIPA